MKDIPNIKPIQLNEEPTDIHQQNNNEIKQSNNNKKFSHFGSLFCLLYFIIVLLFILLFILNYIYTKNAFDQNKNIILPPEKLCNNVIDDYLNCKKIDKFKKICEFRKIELCYDEVNIFNQKCFIFISELELCYRKNKNNKKTKCKNEINDMLMCGKNYKNMHIKNITNLKEIFSF